MAPPFIPRQLVMSSTVALCLCCGMVAEAAAQPMRSPPAHRSGIRKPPIGQQPPNLRPPDLSMPAAFIGSSISGTAGFSGDQTGTTGATGASGVGGASGLAGVGGQSGLAGLGGGGLAGLGGGGGIAGLGGGLSGGQSFANGPGASKRMLPGAGAFTGMKGFGFGGTLEGRHQPHFLQGVGLMGQLTR